MKKAIDCFPISESDAEEVDKYAEAFSDEADLRSMLESFFNIYNDFAEFTPQEFDDYFKDFIS